jgi:hypothetical protein
MIKDRHSNSCVLFYSCFVYFISDFVFARVVPYNNFENYVSCEDYESCRITGFGLVAKPRPHGLKLQVKCDAPDAGPRQRRSLRAPQRMVTAQSKLLISPPL